MSGIDAGVLWVLVLPVIGIWILIVVDILRQPRMSPIARVTWIVAGALVWPTLAVYLLIRPQQARVELAGERSDRHAVLVRAVLDRDSGRIDDAEWLRRVRALRQ